MSIAITATQMRPLAASLESILRSAECRSYSLGNGWTVGWNGQGWQVFYNAIDASFRLCEEAMINPDQEVTEHDDFLKAWQWVIDLSDDQIGKITNTPV